MYRVQSGELLNYFPVNRVIVPVDENVVRQNGTVTAKDSVVKRSKISDFKRLSL
ncbi:MAG: hypothetical protein IPK31_22190 [Chitinophagaceae bacterium]|nr:hypothetical protein [Chitinophagaceae bacterium]